MVLLVEGFLLRLAGWLHCRPLAEQRSGDHAVPLSGGSSLRWLVGCGIIAEQVVRNPPSIRSPDSRYDLT